MENRPDTLMAGVQRQQFQESAWSALDLEARKQFLNSPCPHAPWEVGCLWGIGPPDRLLLKT